MPAFAGGRLGEAFFQKQGDKEGETAGIGGMGGDESVMPAPIIIYDMYPFGDAAIVARGTGTLYEMLDESGGRLVGNKNNEGDAEEDEQEWFPVVSYSVVLFTFFAFSTFVCATAPDDPKQPKIERNPEPSLRYVVPHGILPGSAIVVEPKHEGLVELV